ncbi:hypothetical protein DERP_001742 [Dermatophagoides pteronyssinus]|uniref:Uncharacterized protein n=1 Tax=Dermatophagoides pteronyssinus TaxID=6956 RepID=A0ABQ8JBD1_DERPT|nr:hypothetical protein DERP_001742 [Dermatophagoides pteronyssinus]
MARSADHGTVDTKSFNSPPLSSSCSNVRASPVDCRPITTDLSQRNDSFTNATANFTLDAIQRYLKNL